VLDPVGASGNLPRRQAWLWGDCGYGDMENLPGTSGFMWMGQ